MPLCDVLSYIVAAMHEQGFVPVSRNLIHGIAADLAGIQVVQYLQLVIEAQLLVQELHELFETACVHMPPQFL